MNRSHRRIDPRRRQIALGLALSPALAWAQEQLKTSTIIVGSPAGGATDKMARFFADGLRGLYADNVLVENKPGGGGVIAYEYVKNSRARDGGLTFLSPAYPIVVTPHIVKGLPYNPLTDFIPVAITGRSGMTLVLGPGAPAELTTVEAYLKWAQQNPKMALYGAQTGSSQHLAGSTLSLITKVPLENVSYKGDAPAIKDLVGGHVPAVIMPIASALPLVKNSQARVLAVTRRERSRFLPNVPTFTELGYPLMMQDWMGVFAPAGTPAPIVRKLNEAIAQVARSERGKEAYDTLGFEPDVVSPEQFAEIVQADHKRYGDVIARTGFREAYERAQGGSK
ncbi:Bug family tripartite tricarboxylate transporter substrate binding protein [Hydrogenophaga sp. BPS33]|uniref:Bug family tripartite tricarboxylate transporter substrate binding protein n=1 Tax=Hydrogenophaga sp. BPS33 TaxID=2651974 RepID=UPI0013203147|nr:tripartite tricarboxylate transporter substrate-binding protein [Hydrogenophaga sp. BPS33]QHE88329.1 twin-arginine translocation pathway signal protein [Hydrogenophaga sp. BPS33]